MDGAGGAGPAVVAHARAGGATRAVGATVHGRVALVAEPAVLALAGVGAGVAHLVLVWAHDRLVTLRSSAALDRR